MQCGLGDVVVMPDDTTLSVYSCRVLSYRIVCRRRGGTIVAYPCLLSILSHWLLLARYTWVVRIHVRGARGVDT